MGAYCYISWLGFSPIYETPFNVMYKVQHLFENTHLYYHLRQIYLKKSINKKNNIYQINLRFNKLTYKTYR
jgi:hypothetical protein